MVAAFCLEKTLIIWKEEGSLRKEENLHTKKMKSIKKVLFCNFKLLNDMVKNENDMVKYVNDKQDIWKKSQVEHLSLKL